MPQKSFTERDKNNTEVGNVFVFELINTNKIVQVSHKFEDEDEAEQFIETMKKGNYYRNKELIAMKVISVN